MNDFNLDKLFESIWFDIEDCEISQVSGKAENEYEKLSNEELFELRSTLELELYDLELEKRFVENFDGDPIVCSGRKLYEIERDMDYIHCKIHEVKEELSKRGLKWEGDPDPIVKPKG